jgi:molecular chaperone DnaK
MAEGYVLGIDLGTTYSCSAVVKDGSPHVLASREGYRTIPSIIAFDASGNLLIGHMAKRQFIINPLDTIYGSKRLVGLQFRPEKLEELKKHFNYKIVESKDHQYAVSVAGRILSLPQVSSLILNEIRDVAQDFLDEKIEKAVISVPAYYNDNQRNAVKKAAALAGLKVLRIINEPTAAALAYGFRKGIEKRIAVFDLGGGTFDISIVQVYDEVFEVIGTGGDAFLGGIDIDNRIAAWLIGSFKKEVPGVEFDKVALQRIQDAAEKAKCDMAESQTAEINLPFIAITDDGPLNMQRSLTEEKFSRMAQDVIDRAFVIVERVLKECNLTPDDIDDIILTGGSTRLRSVQKRVEEFFGNPPRKGIHPDEAVAIGAAVLGDVIENHEEDLLLVDVLPVSIGLGDAKGNFHPVVPRNTTVPNEIVKTFVTSQDISKGLKLSVYQGESKLIANNEKLGDFLFKIEIPPELANKPKKVNIYFELDADCLLSVRADPRARPAIPKKKQPAPVAN